MLRSHLKSLVTLDEGQKPHQDVGSLTCGSSSPRVDSARASSLSPRILPRLTNPRRMAAPIDSSEISKGGASAEPAYPYESCTILPFSCLPDDAAFYASKRVLTSLSCNRRTRGSRARSSRLIVRSRAKKLFLLLISSSLFFLDFPVSPIPFARDLGEPACSSRSEQGHAPVDKRMRAVVGPRSGRCSCVWAADGKKTRGLSYEPSGTEGGLAPLRAFFQV